MVWSFRRILSCWNFYREFTAVLWAPTGISFSTERRVEIAVSRDASILEYLMNLWSRRRNLLRGTARSAFYGTEKWWAQQPPKLRHANHFEVCEMFSVWKRNNTACQKLRALGSESKLVIPGSRCVKRPLEASTPGRWPSSDKPILFTFS